MGSGEHKILVTGANRGLGLETTRRLLLLGYPVWASTQHQEGADAILYMAERLQQEYPQHRIGRVTPIWCDVTQEFSYEFRQALKQTDILINNAGWGADLPAAVEYQNPLTMSLGVLDQAIDVNALAIQKTMAVAVPEMVKRGWGRVVNVTSSRAALGTIYGDWPSPAYRLSKLLANGISTLTAHHYRHTGVLINALCPGWCKTRMGGEMAPESVESGAERIVDLAMLPDDTSVNNDLTGGFYIDGQKHSF